MAYDIEKIKQKLEILKNPKLAKAKFEKKTWSPDKDKEKTIRMFHAPSLKEDPIASLHFHYNLGKNSYLCPRMMHDGECPICEFAFEVIKSKSAADKETFKKLMPKQRFYIAVLDREDQTFQPKWWGFGVEMYGELLQSMMTSDYGNFLDPKDGIDAVVTVIAKAGKTAYSAPKLVFKRKDSPLLPADNDKAPKDLKAFMESITPITEVFKMHSKQEMQAALMAWMNPSVEDGEEVVKKSESSDTTSAASSLDSDELEKAFSKALED